MLWNIAVNDAGAEYDPLTLLRTRTMFGRPDWKSIYGRMSQAIQGGQYLPGVNSQLRTRVAVSVPVTTRMHTEPEINAFLPSQTYFCGPGVLAKAIKEACVENNNSAIEFSFAKVINSSSSSPRVQ